MYILYCTVLLTVLFMCNPAELLGRTAVVLRSYCTVQYSTVSADWNMYQKFSSGMIKHDSCMLYKA